MVSNNYFTNRNFSNCIYARIHYRCAIIHDHILNNWNCFILTTKNLINFPCRKTRKYNFLLYLLKLMTLFRRLINKFLCAFVAMLNICVYFMNNYHEIFTGGRSILFLLDPIENFIDSWMFANFLENSTMRIL